MKIRSDFMVHLYFALNGALATAVGHGQEHLRQAYSAKGEDVPRAVLATHEPIGPDDVARLEKQLGVKSGPVQEVQLPPFVFRPDPTPDGRFKRRLAQAKEAEATAPVHKK